MADLNINYWSIAPQTILICFGFMMMLVGAFTGGRKAGNLGSVAAFGLLIAFVTNLFLFSSNTIGFSNMVLYDNIAVFFNAIFIGAGVLVCLISDSYMNEKIRNHIGDYYALILFAVAGMGFMITALDFIMLFLGLETMSLAVYILAGICKRDERSVEASIKYLLLGAFSTAIFLLGIAFLYGTFGTTNFAYMWQNYSKYFIESKNITLVAGTSLVLVGIVFKIAVVPFHMWTPDVYEGAPTPVTAFMATAVKAAAISILLKVFLLGLRQLVFDFAGIIAILAILTMVVGNFSALAQKSVKRMLAYSSIAHAGYILVGFVALNQIGLSAILFYMVSYTLMNIGAFSIIMLFEDKKKSTQLSDLSGKGFKYPFLGFLMTIFMFSLAGVPPTAGFSGKFYIFTGAIQSGYVSLAIIGVLNSAVSAYYYLRVLVHLYFKEDEGGPAVDGVATSNSLAMIVAAAGVLYLGVLPQRLFDITVKSVSYLF